jgi:hypothetical protein
MEIFSLPVSAFYITFRNVFIDQSNWFFQLSLSLAYVALLISRKSRHLQKNKTSIKWIYILKFRKSLKNIRFWDHSIFVYYSKYSLDSWIDTNHHRDHLYRYVRKVSSGFEYFLQIFTPESVLDAELNFASNGAL